MIGKVIRMYRKRNGYSINQLADIAGVSKSYLSKIERGVHKNPSIEFLKKISRALKIDLKELFDTEVILYKRSEHEDEWRTHLLQAVQAGMNQEELFQFTHRLKQKRKERILYRSRELTQANIGEWRSMMNEAKELGLSIQEVKDFLHKTKST
ncbi:helix-turn-helix domain-containing protein [Bacillus sp. CLL-7-23]|uniref:Helix-turn-helix domain-containing protein n=1 Tax=Bacillus changyiensis TaxID=3004103 RepID=A0ABT4X4Y7_9BACI|nr:helix-turn-helix domain-containing protein [Bacillus changyiensis]MDA7027356.1 helix-turn-helix domain-containing protein [Bacillus changyiensis]